MSRYMRTCVDFYEAVGVNAIKLFDCTLWLHKLPTKVSQVSFTNRAHAVWCLLSKNALELLAIVEKSNPDCPIFPFLADIKLHDACGKTWNRNLVYL